MIILRTDVYNIYDNTQMRLLPLSAATLTYTLKDFLIRIPRLKKLRITQESCLGSRASGPKNTYHKDFFLSS